MIFAFLFCNQSRADIRETTMGKRRKNESTGLDRELERYSAMGRTTVSRPSTAGRWLSYGAASAAMVVGSTAEAALVMSTDDSVGVTLDRSVNNTVSTELDVNNDNVADFKLMLQHSTNSDYNNYGFVSGSENAEVDIRGLNSAKIFVPQTAIGETGAHVFQTSNYVGNAESNLALEGDQHPLHFASRSVSYSYSSNSTFPASTTSTQRGNGPGEFVVGVKLGTGEFGWIRLDLEVGPGVLHEDFNFPLSITVLDMAFEQTANAPAHVTSSDGEPPPPPGGGSGSSVPEPGAGALVGLGLLAMGAGGIRRLRQRREAQPAH